MDKNSNRAQLHWENCQTYALKSIEIESKIGLVGLKLLSLLHGSAIVSLLTYISHAENKSSLLELNCSFILFAVGLFLALPQFILAYINQQAITAYFVKCSANSETSVSRKSIVCMNYFIIALSLISLAFAMGGTYKAISVILIN